MEEIRIIDLKESILADNDADADKLREELAAEKTVYINVTKERKVRGGKEKGEMVRWYHQVNGHEFKPSPEYSEDQESLVCSSPWHCKVADTT